MENNNNELILKKCIHQINNFKTLDNDLIEKIHGFSDKDKMQIILTYNKLLDWIQEHLKDFK